TMKLEVVAEGVEDFAQLMILQDECCSLAQGFLLSRPLPAADAHQLLRRLAEHADGTRTQRLKRLLGSRLASPHGPRSDGNNRESIVSQPVHSPTANTFETTPRASLGVWGRRSADGWLDRWIETVEDLARLQQQHPMVDAVIEEQHGRQIRVGNHWLTDWA